ncbi:MAG: DUF4384 domain-containing protein [Thermoguttaceae bacterium]
MRHTPRQLGFVATIAVVLFACTPVYGQTPISPAGRSVLENIRNSQPAFLVRAEVNKTTRSYREGDALSIRAACEVDAYLYVVYQQADGQMYLVFPNRFQPANRVHGRQAVEIPAKSELFRWRVQPPFGREVVKVIASKQPLGELSDPALRQARFTPLTAQQVKGASLDLGKSHPGDWAEHDIDIQTYAADRTIEARGGKRFGVFFGVANYQFNAEYERAYHGRRMNLACCHRDARVLAELLREVGQLSDVRAFANEKATREQVEQSITGWLPVVSRPGDTVFIYFSGHGMELPGEYGGPAGAAMAPYDTVNFGILAELVKRAEQGEPVDRRVVEWVTTVKSAGSVKKAEEALIRHTAISDDLFGHWLQALDGRQVIVILDICHAGGFDDTGKFQPDAGKALEYKFFDDKFSRLKGIGQKDCALLAACGVSQTSMVREEGDLSVMTYYLAEQLRQAAGPLDLVQTHEYCKAKMQEYFLQHPKFTPHEPRLFKYCDGPIFLKP